MVQSRRLVKMSLFFNRVNIFLSLIYCSLFLGILILFKQEDNSSYSQIIAWFVCLWVSSIVNFKKEIFLMNMIILLTVYFFDSKIKSFLFINPKQSWDITMILLSVFNSMPVLINSAAKKLIKKTGINME